MAQAMICARRASSVNVRCRTTDLLSERTF
jgi:hypothetical protein